MRIGASPIVFRDYLPPVLEAVQRQFPRLNMILRAVNQPELIEAIEQDELDLVISLIPDKLSPAVRTVDLLQLELVLLVAKSSRIKSAKELWADKRIAEPLITLKPNELICQVFQQMLTNLGVRWMPKIEMDSLDLIEKYVETGFGVGLSVRVPQKKFPSTIRVLELPDFPSLRLGVIYRAQSDAESKIRSAFLEEVKRQTARISSK